MPGAAIRLLTGAAGRTELLSAETGRLAGVGGPHSRGPPGSREGVPEAGHGFIQLVSDHCVSPLKPTGDLGESQTLPTPTQPSGQPRLSPPSAWRQCSSLPEQKSRWVFKWLFGQLWLQPPPVPQQCLEALSTHRRPSLPRRPPILTSFYPTCPPGEVPSISLRTGGPQLLTPGGPGLSVPWGPSVPSVASQASILRTTEQLRSRP